ncbi:hypothetical protein ATM97_05380 [Nocardia sp. MH4]|nr:hypothetical protein [Nocardia sp. MH4]
MKSRVFELSGAPSSFLSQKNMVNRSELIRQPLLKVHGKASAGDSGAHRALLDFIVVWASGCNIRTIGVGRFRERIAELCESLRADGYELTVSDDCKVQLIPTDSSAAPLAPEITALEEELKHCGYDVALHHYTEAVSHLGNHNYETANSQTRSMFEQLLVDLACDHAGYIDDGSANQGGKAIATLVRDHTKTSPKNSTPGQPLEYKAGGRLVRGLWDILHTNGSHPGRSNAQEARHRLQMATVLARDLLAHFRPSS